MINGIGEKTFILKAWLLSYLCLLNALQHYSGSTTAQHLLYPCSHLSVCFFLSHLDPIGAASFTKGGTRINSQATITTPSRAAWMLVHLFATNPLLHSRVKIHHFPLHKPQLPWPSAPPQILSSPSCGVTDARTLKVQCASTQLLCPSVEILSEMRPG